MNKKTTYSMLTGGLGNQMFQYAAGLSLAKHRNAEFKIDISTFNDAYKRDYGFAEFDLQTPTITSKRTRAPIYRIKQSLKIGWLRLLGEKITISKVKRNGLPLVIEPHHCFWEGFYNIDHDCFLKGFWQSPLYFKGVEDELRQTFDFSKFKSKRTEPIEKAINAAENSVAVHIRRGDYLEVTSHGLCEAPYYQKAHQLLSNAFNNMNVFVFSDDLQAAKEICAGWENTSFISGNSQEEDMMLMALCDHNIIANSSFSWWGAWLNDNPEKMVIGPRYWFSRERLRRLNTIDLLPENYITL